jgi:hypothetical protein
MPERAFGVPKRPLALAYPTISNGEPNEGWIAVLT